MSQKLFSWIVFTIIFFICVSPVAVMVIEAIGKEDILIQLLHSKESLDSFFNSLILSVFVSFMTTLIGTLVGLILGKTNISLKKAILFLMLIPLLLPPYILALGWVDMLGVVGFFSELLFGFLGVSLVLFTLYLPIPVLFVLFYLKHINPHLEEAAYIYCDKKYVLSRVTIPLILPSIILSFLLVFILSFGEYSVANVLRYSVFPLESFVQFSAFYNFDGAIMMAMPMLLIALFVLFIEQFYLEKRIFKYKSFDYIHIFKLENNQKIYIVAIMIFCAFFMVVVPFWGLFSKIGSVDIFLIAFVKCLDSLLHSLLFASVSATILTFFAFIAAYIVYSKVFLVSKLIDMSLIFLFIVPSTVLGIALILFWNRPWIDFVYTSVLIVFFGYFAKYLFLGSKLIQHRFTQMPYSMVEAAMIFGADWKKILKYIFLPASYKVLGVVFIVFYIFILRENTITMLVYPPGYETLPVYIVTQMANGKEEIIAALCIIMTLSALIPFLLAMMLFRKKERA